MSTFNQLKINSIFILLKWIKLTLSKRRNFSRVIEDFENTTRQIKYSYKILRATVRLSEFIDVHEIKKINPLLRSAGLIGEKPYNSMPIKRLTMGVESILGSEDMSDQTAESLAMILDIIDHKLEGDNPEVLLVTDW